MSADTNKQSTKDGYAAFSSGDAAAAMAILSDDIEWVVGGDNPFTGTIKGKEKLGEFWGAIGGAGFTTTPKEFIAEGDKVVALCENSAGGETWNTADVFTFDADGKAVRFEPFGEEGLLDAVLNG